MAIPLTPRFPAKPETVLPGSNVKLMVSLPALPYSDMPKTSFPEALTGALTKTSAVKVPDAGMCTPVVLPVRAKLTSLLRDSFALFGNTYLGPNPSA